MMTDPNSPTSPLQFDHAEFSQPTPAAVCASCSKGISVEYFELNGKLLCAPCTLQIREALTGGSSFGRLVRATGLGLLAVIAGAVLYFGIARLTGYNIGLVAIVLGWLVGTAVHRGSMGRGGVGYQLLAVFLTYLAIGLSQSPDAYEGLSQDGGDGAEALPTWFKVIFSGVLSLVLPVLVGMEAPISGLIFAFALWEAWRRNKKLKVEISGPFKLQANGTPVAEPTPDASTEVKSVG